MFVKRFLLILVPIVWWPLRQGIRAVPVSQQYQQHKTYDQRQHGKVNVHLNLKDFDVIGLLGSDDIPFVPQDYEYVYDYAEMTLKPFASNKTTTLAPLVVDPVKKPYGLMKKKPTSWDDNSPVTRIKIKPVTFNALDNSKFKRFCAPGFTRDKRGNCHSKSSAAAANRIQIQQIADLVKSFRENRIIKQ